MYNESRRNTYYLIENEKTGLVFGALAERFLVTFLWWPSAIVKESLIVNQ